MVGVAAVVVGMVAGVEVVKIIMVVVGGNDGGGSSGGDGDSYKNFLMWVY